MNGLLPTQVTLENNKKYGGNVNISMNTNVLLLVNVIVKVVVLFAEDEE